MSFSSRNSFELSSKLQKKPFPVYLHEVAYNRKTKKVSGYKISDDTDAKKIIDEMILIRPSQLLQRDVSRSIRFFAINPTDEGYQDNTPGRWILRFSKGSENIDKVWEVLVASVVNGELEDIIVYPQNSTASIKEQCIHIYNPNDRDISTIVAMYDKLSDLGLISAHMQEKINEGIIEYKSNAQPGRNEYDENDCLYTNNDILNLKSQITISAITVMEQLIADFNNLISEANRRRNFITAFFSNSQFTEEELRSIGNNKKFFVKTLASIPFTNRQNGDIRALVNSGNCLIDFHRNRYSTGLTNTRIAVNQLMQSGWMENNLVTAAM